LNSFQNLIFIIICKLQEKNYLVSSFLEESFTPLTDDKF
jgi:hypothetical protein